MKIQELNKIEKKFFGFLDIAGSLEITPASARVVAHRYVKNGILTRIKPNIFVLTEKWKNFTIEEKFQTANLLQVPSYISLTTALEYFEITTQIQRNYIECISIRRTFIKEINDLNIRYSKISDRLYFGFEKRKSVFIAQPEKALIDAIYLTSLGRYSIDIAAINIKRLNQEVLAQMSEAYPLKTIKMLRNYGFISTA